MNGLHFTDQSCLIKRYIEFAKTFHIDGLLKIGIEIELAESFLNGKFPSRHNTDMNAFGLLYGLPCLWPQFSCVLHPPQKNMRIEQ